MKILGTMLTVADVGRRARTNSSILQRRNIGPSLNFVTPSFPRFASATLFHRRSPVPPDNDPPYLINSNGSVDRTETDFFFTGHHSPMMAKNLVPIELARRAVRTFAEHGALLADARWSEV
ncbi:MAG: Imm1 family immunity protein [Planctomycetota bacterium]